MCFWIKSADTGAISGPFTLDEIRSQIQAGTATWNDQVHEDTGSEGKSLNSSADWIPISTLCRPESLHRPPTQPQYSKAEPELSGPEHLKALRQNTCYPLARRLIQLMTTAALTLNALVLVFSVFAAVSQTNRMMARDVALFDTVFNTGFFYSLLLIGAAWIPILLLREGLLILVDMADSIVRLNPRSRDGLR
jgi:hypothetical protein